MELINKRRIFATENILLSIQLKIKDIIIEVSN